MTPAALLKIAQGFIGYREGQNNDTTFGRWYGLNFNPWCAMFVSYCFAQIGASKLIAASTSKGFASCDAGLKFFAKRGQLVSIANAQPGDIVFFQFDEDSIPEHVGIVVANLPKLKRLVTIEGNTSADRKGSQANGDGCFQKTRSYSQVMAIARPKWPAQA